MFPLSITCAFFLHIFVCMCWLIKAKTSITLSFFEYVRHLILNNLIQTNSWIIKKNREKKTQVSYLWNFYCNFIMILYNDNHKWTRTIAYFFVSHNASIERGHSIMPIKNWVYMSFLFSCHFSRGTNSEKNIKCVLSIILMKYIFLS